MYRTNTEKNYRTRLQVAIAGNMPSPDFRSVVLHNGAKLTSRLYGDIRPVIIDR